MLITGNTYPVKDRLRALGGRWNRGANGWDVPEDKAEEARAIVAAAGPAKPRDTYRRGRRYGRQISETSTREDGTTEIYTNPRGRCEDAPCCGCCS